ncbi:zinc-binding dehydrogenase [Sphingomonas sp. 2R-10]|uniref:zinc-binding dehydrogenase n=1 Tax=Sphingomonas sp. 2R-10 TaxID=3045148 RepID=UPI000F7B0B8D|nr:zinc-binding dehydrogenase [Sphingomonas sp. 2R-10]MDJ0278379.1 zinc-binding dehydrogenase [Sphingomonas sp. 2R-10]
MGSRREQQEFVRALDATGIRPVVDRRFALEELAEAFRFQERSDHFGRIGVAW